MKKFLFLCAVALTFAACGQNENKDKKEQRQVQEKETIVPKGVPVAPMQNVPVQPKGDFDQTATTGSSDGPVLKLEEGKPLDFSQLNMGRKSLQDQLTERIDTIRNRAEQDKTEFVYLYGLCYENGWGVEKNVAQAYKWYSKAAEKEFPAACNALGNFYRMGNGVKVDLNKAFEWYKKGANGKDDQAMLNLGNCYFYGMGTAKDEKAALKWWKDAAEAGNAYALSQMGDCYYYGIGVEKDLAKAIENYTTAADKNISNAQYRLGILYYTGNGVQQDQTYAKLLMQKARNGGMHEAQEFLNKNFKN